MYDDLEGFPVTERGGREDGVLASAGNPVATGVCGHAPLQVVRHRTSPWDVDTSILEPDPSAAVSNCAASATRECDGDVSGFTSMRRSDSSVAPDGTYDISREMARRIPAGRNTTEGIDHGHRGQAKNAAEDAIGKAKEVIGDVTGNEKLEAEGKKDQGVSGVKKVGENIKDTFNK